MCHLSREDVIERNRQFKEQMMSKNPTKDFQIETLDDNNQWVMRMDSVSESYLDSVGRRWVEGKFTKGYRITRK